MGVVVGVVSSAPIMDGHANVSREFIGGEVWQ
jgi:hypothetical protein